MKKNKKGFTLIEMLVVTIIIAILAAIAMPQYAASVERSRAQEALVVLRSVKDAADRYRTRRLEYPSTFKKLDVELPKGHTCATDSQCEFGKFTYTIEPQTSCIAARTGDRTYSIERIFSPENTIWCRAATGNKKDNDFCSNYTGEDASKTENGLNYYLIN